MAQLVRYPRFARHCLRLHHHPPVIVTGLSGHIEWANDGFTRVSGYSLGRNPGDWLQGPETDPAVVAHMRSCLAARLGFPVKILNYAKTGRSHWLSIEVQSLPESQGRISGFMVIQLDSSARKQPELGLHQSARLLSRMSELSKVGVRQVDVQCIVPVWSGQVDHIHDLEPGTELNRETAINFYHPSVRDEVQRLVARAIQTGQGWDCEWPLNTAKWVQVRERTLCRPQRHVSRHHRRPPSHRSHPPI